MGATMINLLLTFTYIIGAVIGKFGIQQSCFFFQSKLHKKQFQKANIYLIKKG